jgi:hypothetical protein
VSETSEESLHDSTPSFFRSRNLKPAALRCVTGDQLKPELLSWSKRSVVLGPFLNASALARVAFALWIRNASNTGRCRTSFKTLRHWQRAPWR